MNNNTYPPSIALLVCHFGPYPWYLPYFIHSCKFNPTVDFYIITDNLETIPNKPSNVKIVSQTLDTFKENIFNKLGFKLSNLNNNNKLADFKPAYGFLFPEITIAYAFWGYTELDVVFGNIRDFITVEILENHDVISGRHDSIYAKFCLFKNCQKTQSLFMQSRDYRYVFSKLQKFYFDGCNVILDEEEQYSILDFPDCIQSMTYVVKKLETEGKIKVFYDFFGLAGLLVLSNEIYWDKGVLNYKNQFECLYYDLSQYYNLCKHKKVWSIIPDKFGFDIKGIKKLVL